MGYTPEKLNSWAQEIEKHKSTCVIYDEGFDPLWAILQLRAHAAALEKNAKLKSAIRWALGYDEGEPHFEAIGR